MLDFTSLFPFHLIIIYIVFVHTLLYVMALQVEKICVLDLPTHLLLAYLTKLFQLEISELL